MMRLLDEPERDRVWVSTLTGAQYKWGGDQWMVKTAFADWHHAWRPLIVVRAQAGEAFIDATGVDPADRPSG